MPTCKTDLEQRLYDALKRITKYETAERLLKNGERTYGVPGVEVLEMAYENIMIEAKRGIAGVRTRRGR
jgi:hypothetical protein